MMKRDPHAIGDTRPRRRRPGASDRRRAARPAARRRRCRSDARATRSAPNCAARRAARAPSGASAWPGSRSSTPARTAGPATPPARRLADRRRVGRVILVAPDIGLHVRRRDQSDLVREPDLHLRPMMRRRTGLHRHEARRKPPARRAGTCAQRRSRPWRRRREAGRRSSPERARCRMGAEKFWSAQRGSRRSSVP